MVSENNKFLFDVPNIGVGFVGGGFTVTALGIVCPRAAFLPIGRFRLQH
jgi:hypothetical protein